MVNMPPLCCDASPEPDRIKDRYRIQESHVVGVPACLFVLAPLFALFVSFLQFCLVLVVACHHIAMGPVVERVEQNTIMLACMSCSPKVATSCGGEVRWRLWGFLGHEARESLPNRVAR